MGSSWDLGLILPAGPTLRVLRHRAPSAAGTGPDTADGKSQVPHPKQSPPQPGMASEVSSTHSTLSWNPLLPSLSPASILSPGQPRPDPPTEDLCLSHPPLARPWEMGDRAVI